MPSQSSQSNSALLRNLFFATAILLSAAAVFSVSRLSAEEARVVPPPAVDAVVDQKRGLETAVFAGGCFWGVQGVFQHVRGVTDAVSGYAGGSEGTAKYTTVGTGTTGHAESVRVTFDPSKISYGRLLQIYFSVALDPTELNRQGPDTGTQYRSTIFPAELRTSEGRVRLHRPAQRGPRIFEADRDDRRAWSELLCGRGLSSELPDAQSRRILTSSSTTCRRSKT